MPTLPPSSAVGRGPNDDQAERRKRRQSLIDDRRKRKSLIPQHSSPMQPSREKVVSVDVEPSPIPLHVRVSKEEMVVRFEEWMKIAADNKINANNSWNLALIDYFHDMTILREGDSVNFQKASCTLDGCVKIYTSRIDSVDSETRKLLNGLTESIGQDDVGDEEGEEGEVVKKKRQNRSGNTLEKDFHSLNIKKFDLEFTVDPLFKKTSADFDEGGARGLLLNHLSIHSNGKIIFDAGDVNTAVADDAQDAAPALLDLSKVKALFGTNLDDIFLRAVCPSLKSFSFSDDKTDMPFEPRSEMPQNLAEVCIDIENEEFLGYDDVDDVNDIEDFDGMENDEGDFYSAPEQHPDGGVQQQQGYLTTEKTDRQGFVMNMKEEDENMFGYFDTQMMRSWAGPEHYRLRPIRVQKETVTFGTEAKSTRQKKEPFTIDFITGENTPTKVLFAESKASISIKLERSSIKNLLPEDTHFSSKNLLRLFLKPRCSLKFRQGQRVRVVNLDSTPVDENFWSEHQNENVVFGGEGAGIQEQNQSFADFEDDGDHAYGLDAEAYPISQELDSMLEDVDYGSQLVAEPKKVKAIYLNYAKTAKRVDVRLLKENIWKELAFEDFAGKEENSSKGVQQPTDKMNQEEHKFTDIVGGLTKFYPEKQFQDISVPFCFICLLHLANERNLTIENSNGGLTELLITQDA